MSCPIFMVFVAVAAFLVYQQSNRQQERRKVWEVAAAELGLRLSGGTLFEALHLRGSHDGIRIGVDEIRRGKSDNSVTRYRIAYPSLKLGMQISRQTSKVERLRSALTGKNRDLEIGDRAFDDVAYIRAHEASQIRQFLTPDRRRRVRTFLARPRAVVTDTSSSWEQQGVPTDAKTLIEAVRELMTLAETLTSSSHTAGPATPPTPERRQAIASAAAAIAALSSAGAALPHVRDAAQAAGLPQPPPPPSRHGGGQDPAAAPPPLPPKPPQPLDPRVANEALASAAGIAERISDEIGERISDAEPEAVALPTPVEDEPADEPTPPKPETEPEQPPDRDPDPDQEVEAAAEPEPDPEPVPAPSSAPSIGGSGVEHVCTTLFAAPMGADVEALFADEFEGLIVVWKSTILRAERYYSDAKFGDGPGTRVVVAVHDVETEFGARRVEADVQLPENAYDRLDRFVGRALLFEGHLVGVEPFMRRLQIAGGRILELEGETPDS